MKDKIKLNNDSIFKTLYENAAIGIFYIDENENILTVNPAFLLITGYSNSSELNGENFGNTFCVSIKEHEQFLTILSDEGTIHGFKTKLRKKNGEIIDVMLSASLVKLNGGKPHQIEGTIHDITEQTEIGEKLAESEQKYRSLIEQSNDAIYLLYNKRFEIINKKFTDLFGYTIEEINGGNFNFFNLVAPESLPIIKERIEKFKAGEKLSPIYEFKAITKSGNIIDCETSVAYIDYKKGSATQGIIRDITERKQLMRKIKLLARFPDENPNPVLRITLGGTIKYGNKASSTLLKKWKSSVGEKIPSDWLQTLISAYNSKRTKKVEIECGNQSFLLAFEPICNEEYINVYGLDITQRKHMMEELKENEKKFKTVADFNFDWEYWITPEKNLRYVSPSCKRITGYSRSDFMENPNLLMTLVHIDDRNLFEQHLFEEHENHVNASFEFRIITKQGELKWIGHECQPVYDERNNYLGQRASNRDITSQKIAVLQLRKLYKAVEQSPSSVVITDIQGNIEYVNPKFTEVTGYLLPEVFGENPRVLKSENFDNDYYKNLWTTILSGEEWRGEFLNKKKSGELFWVSASISPIKDETGEITNFLALEEDITERKKIESELIKAKEKAEKSDKLKSEFLAQMSHEIRTPIHNIISFTSLIKDEIKPHLNKDLTMGFDIIRRAGDRIIRTVDLLINMSELQTNNYKVIKTEFNVGSLLEKLYYEYKIAADEKKLVFKLINKTNNSIIYADKYSVEQIFRNLMDNALKYTYNGSVELSMLKNSVPGLVFKITDSGVGISKEYLPHIFEPFSQEEQGYTRRFEGNGLGLSLVKKYSEINNAQISVSSEKGVGSTFKVIFNTKE